MRKSKQPDDEEYAAPGNRGIPGVSEAQKSLIPDPGAGQYDRKKEAEIRHMIEMHAAYAESGPTFDKKGKYLCGDCSMRVLPDRCTVVGGVDISMSHGGCRRWEGGSPMGDELPKKSDPWLVGYGERENGFGCARCEYAERAAEPDGARTLWCSFWGLCVLPGACCEENDGEDLVEPYECEVSDEQPGEAS